MKPLLLVFLLTASGLGFAPGVSASESNPRAEEGFEGEVEVTLKNAEYVKVQINGVDTDNVEFARNGKLAIIKGLDLQAERTAITLLPIAALGQVELDVVQKDFKKVRKGRTLRFVASKTVTFPKADEAPKPAPAPAQPEVAPEPEREDDL